MLMTHSYLEQDIAALPQPKLYLNLVGFSPFMRRGQTGIEYVLAMVGLLIMLITLYEISVGMNGRLSALQARMEGGRVAAQLGTAMDWTYVLGGGARTNISLYSFPAQHLIIKESEIVILDQNEQTVGFGRHMGRVVTQATVYANATVGVNNTGGSLRAAEIPS